MTCTQPRRVACTSVASYVARRAGVTLGKDVGYNVRFDRRCDVSTSILYQTDGMLLRDACTGGGFGRLLGRYRCIVVDEAHERSIATDVIIPIVRQAMLARNYNRNVKSDKDVEECGADVRALRKLARKRKVPPLTVVVMSATITADVFAEYFGAAKLEVPGRTFGVDVCYLAEPASDYVEACVEACLRLHGAYEEGDILCFLPGQEEIREALYGVRRGLEVRNPSHSCKPLLCALLNPSSFLRDIVLLRFSLQSREEGSNLVKTTKAGGDKMTKISGADISSSLDVVDSCVVFPLYASLPSTAQSIIFDPLVEGERRRGREAYRCCSLPSVWLFAISAAISNAVNTWRSLPHAHLPAGCNRRIILATNIAETSVTLPDVVFVVDSGMEKVKGTEATGVGYLKTKVITKASARQRSGRCGRTR